MLLSCRRRVYKKKVSLPKKRRVSPRSVLYSKLPQWGGFYFSARFKKNPAGLSQKNPGVFPGRGTPPFYWGETRGNLSNHGIFPGIFLGDPPFGKNPFERPRKMVFPHHWGPQQELVVPLGKNFWKVICGECVLAPRIKSSRFFGGLLEF